MNNDKLTLKDFNEKEQLKKIKKNFEHLYLKIESFFNSNENFFIENVVLFSAHLNLSKLKKEDENNEYLRFGEYKADKVPIFKNQFPFFLFNTSDKDVFFVLGGALNSIFISLDEVMVCFTQSNTTNAKHPIMLDHIAYKKNSYYAQIDCPKRTTNIFINKLNILLYATKNENIKMLNFDLNSSLELYKKYESVSKNKMTVVDNKSIKEYFEFNALLNDKMILPQNILIKTKKDNKIIMVNK